MLACAEAVGGIARTVEMSVEYAKVRHQFGKPIGSFQAVKHRCADMAVRAEVARSATTYTAVSVRDGAADADFQVAVAKLLCANAYLQNAADNVQNHGGMGFTWECDAHLFVKRSRAFDATIGPRRAAGRRPGGAVPRRLSRWSPPARQWGRASDAADGWRFWREQVAGAAILIQPFAALTALLLFIAPPDPAAFAVADPVVRSIGLTLGLFAIPARGAAGAAGVAAARPPERRGADGVRCSSPPPASASPSSSRCSSAPSSVRICPVSSRPRRAPRPASRPGSPPA